MMLPPGHTPASSSASSSTHAPWTPKPGHFTVRIDPKGKVHHAAKDSPTDRTTHKGSYLHIPVARYAAWKGAGKRTERNKFTDPETGQNYARVNGRYHPYLPGKALGVTPVPDNDAPLGGQSSHDLLHAKLVDRSRADRTAMNSPLLRYDVGPYEAPVTLGINTYPALPKAQGAWEANNDHIPSGQSLKLRNSSNSAEAERAYNQGITIAIPADEHRFYSPTYGGRQSTRDTTGGVKEKRVEHDEESPASAAVRDITTMVNATEGSRTQDERTQQLGGYRTLWRMNTRIHDQLGSGRGVDSSEVAEDAVHAPKKLKGGGSKIGTFDYSGGGTATQGEVMSGRFGEWLVNAKLAER